mmetsp:Transcript_25317/g.76110  ORF Transcript_25317/g.76110 Transcript_25317/m.76110 type:complete len:216 (-) Transcript_25317:23-670(-)
MDLRARSPLYEVHRHVRDEVRVGSAHVAADEVDEVLGEAGADRAPAHDDDPKQLLDLRDLLVGGSQPAGRRAGDDARRLLEPGQQRLSQPPRVGGLLDEERVALDARDAEVVRLLADREDQAVVRDGVALPVQGAALDRLFLQVEMLGVRLAKPRPLLDAERSQRLGDGTRAHCAHRRRWKHGREEHMVPGRDDCDRVRLRADVLEQTEGAPAGA